jgi:pyruvate formate lyase activating enzyme
MSAAILTKNVPTSAANLPRHFLKVGGMTPFTATDFPGKLSAVVFVQGCPWRCGYCHNPHLQPRPAHSPLDWNNILALLKRRVGLIDAVVFSGGESTIDPALAAAIADIRALGFQIGLHTAGIYPQRLQKLLPTINWVGMDIKAPFDSYARITGIAASGAPALASTQAIIASGVAHEFRTTIHPALLNEAEVLALARALAAMGVQNYALQIFRAEGCSDLALRAQAMGDYPSPILVRHLTELFPQFTLRRA